MTTLDVFDPTPRFERIANSICPDCDGNLSESGYCIDCHIVPALDPDYQEWLKAQPLKLHIPKRLSVEAQAYWLRRAEDLCPGKLIQAEFVNS